MALLRALSTTKGRRGGYDKLLDETNDDSNTCVGNQQTPVLKRVMSVPERVLFGSSSRKIKTTSSSYSSSSPWERNFQANNNNNNNNNKSKKKQETKKEGKVHPVFGLFDGRSWSKRKFTTNPDFSRYIDYLKVSGIVVGIVVRIAIRSNDSIIL
ncbi:uncharacterized protein LOC141634262 [Silene latifolia]|uniref:uncharacterized protein LOC141634262 n=1 Tax=Silene latifolia TaxID=37657 RepID=UPI003D776959